MRRWCLVAGAALIIALVAGTWWLLTKDTRGAEIATVLALPVAVTAAVAGLWAVVVAVRPAGTEAEKLADAARNLTGEVLKRDGEAGREVEGQDATKTKVGGHIGLPDSWGLGRLARHQLVLAAAALVSISFVVFLVIVVTRFVTTIPVGTSPVTSIPVGTGPRGVAVTPDGRHAYISNYGSNSVSVIEIGSG